ncbi:reverse transcriptase domain-containing protein, partial [Tanacetum coccineum]
MSALRLVDGAGSGIGNNGGCPVEVVYDMWMGVVRSPLRHGALVNKWGVISVGRGDGGGSCGCAQAQDVHWYMIHLARLGSGEEAGADKALDRSLRQAICEAANAPHDLGLTSNTGRGHDELQRVISYLKYFENFGRPMQEVKQKEISQCLKARLNLSVRWKKYLHRATIRNARKDISVLQYSDPDLDHRPRTAVKGQILADFLIKKPETDAVLPQSEVKLQEPWILFTDGSSCVDGSGAGLILTNPEGMEFTYALRFEFTATNNEAEYEALIAGLRIAARMGVRNLEANVDSRLVANHVLGEYVAKEDNMIQYLDKTKSLIQGFDRFTIRQVPRGDNKKADALSKIASTSFAHLSKQVLVEILKNKSISEMEISTVIEEQDPTWMTPIIEFISKGTLPHEQKDARRIRRTAQRFELRNGVLYRRSFLQPWLRCVGPIQADYVLREIHAGSCSMHSGPRSVVARALRSGYYWPTMHRDARDMIKKCNDCQVHRPIPRQPQQELTPITSPWPFHKWGIDIAGPFPVAAGGLKFLIVAIDYFTKWIEAKAVATITGNQVKRFVWDNIVCRFGLPGEIVSDNGKQFCDNPFKDWCARLSITQRFASVKHPQTNGLVERANRSLGEGIKARLDRHKGRWVEELSHVLWAHRTTIKVSTGDTPFSLVYGTEAVIPAEIGMPTMRTAEVNTATNDDERRIDLDILEERREQAAIREEKAKLKMKGYYDAKVRGVSFRLGDFVYRANDASCVTWMGVSCPTRGISAISRNAIFREVLTG